MPATGEPSPIDARRLRPHTGWVLLVALACFTAFGLVLASQIVLSSNAFGREMPWRVALTAGLTDSLLWLPLVLPIVWLANRFPLGSDRWLRDLGILLAAALLATGAYAALHALTNEYLISDSLQIGRYFMRPNRPPPPPPADGTREGPPPSTAERADRPERTEPGHERGERGGRGRGREAESKNPTLTERATFNLTTRWHMHLLMYMAIVGVAHWSGQQRRLHERDAHARELSRQLAEARLQALRMQLNPHFLFNTLNAVATLLHRAPQAADEMISSLSDFLRLTLSSNNQPQTTLDRELEFARRYLDIEKARFGDRLIIREYVGSDCLACLVPTLVLQPLLENAVRHGIEPLEQPGVISLHASRDRDHLVVTITDTGAGLLPKSDGRTGIGLANTRQRLRELHGDAASLTLTERTEGGLCVELRIPWTKNDAHASPS